MNRRLTPRRLLLIACVALSCSTSDRPRAGDAGVLGAAGGAAAGAGSGGSGGAAIAATGGARADGTGGSGGVPAAGRDGSADAAGGSPATADAAVGSLTQRDAAASGGGGDATGSAIHGEPCLASMTINGGQSGNFNTTDGYCFRTSDKIEGWGCTSFDGRTVEVNGVTVACGAMPLPARWNGYDYFHASAGTFPYASIYWWSAAGTAAEPLPSGSAAY